MITKHALNGDFQWLAVSNFSDDDYDPLIGENQVTDEMLNYATDPDERGRLEYDAKSAIITIIFDVVTTAEEEGTHTEQVSFMLVKHRMITFTTDSTQFVEKILADIIAEDFESVDQPIDYIFEAMYRLSRQYFQAINNINLQRQAIQTKMRKQIQRSVILQLMGLETTLVYFLTSLKSNNDVLQGFKRTSPIQLTDLQKDRLEDIIVEAQQGSEMTNIASDIIDRVSNAYTNILDNNLNNTMWLLTVLSIVIAMPNIVFGFFGQNVPLPFSHNSLGWELTIVVALVLCVITFIILQRNNRFPGGKN